ncbi:hypothetical protein Hamer_G005278 [Homarus americanus]|uniref:Uncharacterized protein n=1 Tax=Homarus americanus TaxID=6706 RepID=A0A8J5K2E0_HOMAM|nr:hypothetical protein Hamer_G005278 [Homarus americanus]
MAYPQDDETPFGRRKTQAFDVPVPTTSRPTTSSPSPPPPPPRPHHLHLPVPTTSQTHTREKSAPDVKLPQFYGKITYHKKWRDRNVVVKKLHNGTPLTEEATILQELDGAGGLLYGVTTKPYALVMDLCPGITFTEAEKGSTETKLNPTA